MLKNELTYINDSSCKCNSNLNMNESQKNGPAEYTATKHTTPYVQV